MNFDMLDTLPTEKWNGGKIHRIHPSFLHLMRGQAYELDDRSIPCHIINAFCMCSDYILTLDEWAFCGLYEWAFFGNFIDIA